MAKEPLQGPYKHTFKKTIKIAPIEITFHEETDSTHVPPADCGCGGGSSPLEAILAAVQQYAAQAAAAPASPVPDDGGPEGGGHTH